MDRGQTAECLCELWLRALGWRIVERRWRSHPYEIDIVALDGDELVFVEVKSSFSGRWNPEMAISERKIDSLREAAERWLTIHPCEGKVRFDVVAVSRRPDGAWHIEHFRDAFR